MRNKLRRLHYVLCIWRRRNEMGKLLTCAVYGKWSRRNFTMLGAFQFVWVDEFGKCLPIEITSQWRIISFQLNKTIFVIADAELSIRAAFIEHLECFISIPRAAAVIPSWFPFHPEAQWFGFKKIWRIKNAYYYYIGKLRQPESSLYNSLVLNEHLSKTFPLGAIGNDLYGTVKLFFDYST